MVDFAERPSQIDAAWDKPPSSEIPSTAPADPAQAFSTAEELFAEGRLEDAWELAESARATYAVTDPVAETEALYLLACIAQRRGFARVGQERVAKAIQVRAEIAPGSVPMGWYELHAALATANGEHTTAASAWEAAVKSARSVRDATGEATDRLCIALRALGDEHLARGDHARAREAFSELVTEARTLAPASADPQAFRHITSAHHRLGDAAHAAGDLPAAIAAYRDAVREAKRTVTASGESPEALWDLSVGLNRLGSAQLEAEQAQAAIASFEQSVDARRSFVDQIGRNAQALNGLASSLAKLAAALHHDGDEAGAAAAAEEAAALDLEAALDGDGDPHPQTMVPPPVAG